MDEIKIAQARVEHNLLAVKVAELKDQNVRWGDQLKEKEIQIKESIDKYTKFQESLAEIESKFIKADEALTKTQKQLNDVTNEVAKLRIEIAKGKLEKEALIIETEKLNLEISATNEVINKKRASLDEREKTIVMNEATLNGYKNELDIQQANIDKERQKYNVTLPIKE